MEQIDKLIEARCLAQKGTQQDYKEEWHAWRYLVGGKMYAMRGGDKEGRPILTLKLPPDQGYALREQYAGVIVPGYYMNKEHWNSIYLSGGVPGDILGKLIETAYQTALRSLSKKAQAEILEKEEK